jgi:hypothetical protein
LATITFEFNIFQGTLEIYLGATDTTIEGAYVWQTSKTSAAAYTNWAWGEPNICCGGENCMEMRPDGLWMVFAKSFFLVLNKTSIYLHA